MSEETMFTKILNLDEIQELISYKTGYKVVEQDQYYFRIVATHSEDPHAGWMKKEETTIRYVLSTIDQFDRSIGFYNGYQSALNKLKGLLQI